MESLVEYSKSRAPLKEREALLFNVINFLDKESYNLYSEIIDLDKESLYKTEDLSIKISILMDLYNQVKESYEYLLQIELSSYNYALKRHQAKEFLTLLTTFYTFMASPIFAIASFVILNRMATKSFVEELKEIEETVKQFEIEDKMHVIHSTIANSLRILNGKTERCHEQITNQNNKENSSTIILANTLISLCLSGEISKEALNGLSEPLKNKITEILKKDLNTDETDLSKLIDLSKDREKNDKILVK